MKDPKRSQRELLSVRFPYIYNGRGGCSRQEKQLEQRYGAVQNQCAAATVSKPVGWRAGCLWST